MPIYEYHCEDCGKDFEYLVIGKADPECEACNSRKVTRLMSACGHKSGGESGGSYAPSSGASSGCASCSGGDCSSCH